MFLKFMRCLVVLLLLAVCVMYSSASAQAGQVTVKGSWPVANALKDLEKIYRWPITYEDLPDAPPSEIVDVTAQTSREKHPSRRIMGLKERALTFTLEDSPSTEIRPAREDLPEVLRAIREVLNRYADQRGADMFTVIQNDTLFHVVPTQFFNASGELEKAAPILDTPISLPPKERTVGELFSDICDAVTLASGENVGVLSFPLNSAGVYPKNQITVNNEPARSALDRLLQEIKISGEDGRVPLFSWQLIHSPDLKEYFLNVEIVN